MERPFHSFKQDIAKMRAATDYTNNSKELDYEEALNIVRDSLGEKLESLSAFSNIKGNDKTPAKVKDKEYLREKLRTTRTMVSDIVMGGNFAVRGYAGTKIHDFIEEATQEFSGYSILDDAFNDDAVSDIYCLEYNKIFVEKNNAYHRYHKNFRDAKSYKIFVDRILREAEKEVNDGDKKIVDFELYGDRGCVTSKAVSPKDFSITLRKHSEDHVRLPQMIQQNVLTQEMADLLGQIIKGQSNLIYAGLTGSGKTTSIRALLNEYAKLRILVCEDTQELFLNNEHTVELVSVKSENPSLRVSMIDLVITALRLKPKYIVVGEVRGEEAMAAVEAMETGHSTTFTMHGGTSWNCVNRLVTKYLTAMPSLGIEVVERIIGCSVDYIAIQDDIPGVGRRLSSIEEISYDFAKRTIVLKPILTFDVQEQKFQMVGKLSREKANNMMRRGVKWEDISQWVEEEEDVLSA